MIGVLRRLKERTDADIAAAAALYDQAFDPRPSFDEYFLGIAQAVAARADCTRRQVGAVLVKDNHVIGTGYNGAPSGEPGCLTAGACPRGQQSKDAVAPGSSYDTGAGSCVALHAEQNAVLHAVRSPRGASIYITDEPCDGCARFLRGAGVVRVVTP